MGAAPSLGSANLAHH